MTHTLLLEIGLEEIPARFVVQSSAQLVERMAKFLEENRIAYENIKPFATPRRLTVLVSGVADKQTELNEHVKGPAKAIAQDEDGNWTKAAEGFARGQGLDVSDITFEDVDGKSYVFVDKKTVGKDTAEALVDLKEVVTSMTFPVTMRWGHNSFEYIRPIHWLTVMLDDVVIPFDILDVTTSNELEGHRFLGKRISLNTASDYEHALEAEYVIADRDKRKSLILDQIHALESGNDFKVARNDDLLDEVTDLVEYPTAFVGNFSEDFLQLPEEVLVTSMQDHQRYFAVYDDQEKLLPRFVSVRNGNEEHIENVIAGNEKVLVARLSDGLFFYEEDRKKDIKDFSDKLDKVVFHEGLGTMNEKVNRLRKMGTIIGKEVGLSDRELKVVDRVAELSKFDLTTGLVDEFSELQGNMGGIYAKSAGESDEVSQAIYEQYYPTSSDGELPSSTAASVIAIADKLDNLIMFFGAGIIPTGSNDPNALRRQAYGLLRIMLENNWSLDMEDLVEEVATQVDFPTNDFIDGIKENKNALNSFFKSRVRQYLERANVPHNIIEAVLASSKHNFVNVIESARVLNNHQNDENYKDFVEQTSRVLNLYDKAEELGYTDATINADKLVTDSEKKLANLVESFDENIGGEAYYQALINLNDPITTFFENNMVMADDESEKENRLNLIYNLGGKILQFADTRQLVING